MTTQNLNFRIQDIFNRKFKQALSELSFVFERTEETLRDVRKLTPDEISEREQILKDAENRMTTALQEHEQGVLYRGDVRRLRREFFEALKPIVGIFKTARGDNEILRGVRAGMKELRRIGRLERETREKDEVQRETPDARKGGLLGRLFKRERKK